MGLVWAGAPWAKNIAPRNNGKNKNVLFMTDSSLGKFAAWQRQRKPQVASRESASRKDSLGPLDAFNPLRLAVLFFPQVDDHR
jgi:hypothetical protein